MRYRKQDTGLYFIRGVGYTLQISPKSILLYNAERLVKLAEKQIVKLHFKCNPSLVSINWQRRDFT